MSYQYSSPFSDHKLENQEVLPVDDAPNVVWMPMLVPVEAFFPNWGYVPQMLYNHGVPQMEEHLDNVWPADEDDQETTQPVPAESCSASADASDSFSDASTDVGDGDDIAEDFEEETKHPPVKDSTQVDAAAAPKRPSLFVKLSRQQRVDQLRRLIDEYCTLDFDSVDVTSQEGLAFRMLTMLKSLSESTTFHEDEGCSREKRLYLLGLGQDDEDAIADVVSRTQVFCEQRSFRNAFDVLKEVAPRFIGNASAACNQVSSKKIEELASPTSRASVGAGSHMSTEEIEAMKQRRSEKRQRQRQDRRVQRAADRADRAAHRGTTTSGGAAATTPQSRYPDPCCQQHNGASMKWSRK